MNDPSRVCNSPVTYPNPVWGAIGGTVHTVPMICGGWATTNILLATNRTEKSCYKFDKSNYAWTYSHDLITERAFFASANFMDHLWVTGGQTRPTLDLESFENISSEIQTW